MFLKEEFLPIHGYRRGREVVVQQFRQLGRDRRSTPCYWVGVDQISRDLAVHQLSLYDDGLFHRVMRHTFSK